MPTCIADVLIDRPQFPQPVVDAIKGLRDAKPYRGTYAERCGKFEAATAAINAALDMSVEVQFVGEEISTSVNSRAGRRDDGQLVIVMVGKLSVITFLCLYAACMVDHDPAMGDHWARMRWAVNLFKRFFPRSFAGCRTDGIYLTR